MTYRYDLMDALLLIAVGAFMFFLIGARLVKLFDDPKCTTSVALWRWAQMDVPLTLMWVALAWRLG